MEYAKANCKISAETKKYMPDAKLKLLVGTSHFNLKEVRDFFNSTMFQLCVAVQLGSAVSDNILKPVKTVTISPPALATIAGRSTTPKEAVDKVPPRQSLFGSLYE